MKKNGTKKDRTRWGRKGGKIGGRRRALALSAKRRREIAADGARAMWAKRREAEAQCEPEAGVPRETIP